MGTGCNIHWIAGLVLMIWGLFWMFATPFGTLLFLFFAYVIIFFLPCVLAIPVGIISLVSIGPSKAAAGKLPEDDSTEARAATSQYAAEPEYAAGPQVEMSHVSVAVKADSKEDLPPAFD